jgi:tyrosyl-DNA phosphodiesterase 1
MKKVLLGFRMPYDLPLVKYTEDEEVWCASQPSNIPDWRGEIWPHRT